MLKKIRSFDKRISVIEIQLENLNNEVQFKNKKYKDRILDFNQGMDFLKLSHIELLKLIEKKEVPFLKLSEDYFFDREELSSWLKQKLLINSTTTNFSQTLDTMTGFFLSNDKLLNQNEINNEEIDHLIIEILKCISENLIQQQNC